MRHGPGNFAFNLVTAVGLMAAGAHGCWILVETESMAIG